MIYPEWVNPKRTGIGSGQGVGGMGGNCLPGKIYFLIFIWLHQALVVARGILYLCCV